MEFSEIDEFKKEFKRLKKKYISLEDDIGNLKEVLVQFPKGTGSRHWNKLKELQECFMFKTRMMCRSVRGAAFRIIYFFDEKNNKIVFIEVYYKSEQINEDKKRVKEEFARLAQK